jgi:hypothetical protein
VKNQPSSNLLKALAVCAELTGTDLSQSAIRVMADDLAQFPEHQVLGALTRCRKELKGRITIADVINRLDDGRPGPQEAWSIVAPALDNEDISIVMSDEMAHANGIAHQLSHDKVAARMAFIEAYQSAVSEARNAGKPVHWLPSLGHDKAGRDGPLLAAVEAGRLLPDHVSQFLIGDNSQTELKRIGNAIAMKGLLRDFGTDTGLQP